jgi:hypothetical protein
MMNTGSVILHAAKSAVITAGVSAVRRERRAAGYKRTVARDGAVARDERDAEAAVAHDAHERRDLDLLPDMRSRRPRNAYLNTLAGGREGQRAVRAGRARGDVQEGRKLADEHAGDGNAAARTLVLAREEGAEVGEAADAGAEAAVVRERAALAVRRARRAHERRAGVAWARGSARA